MNCVGDELVNRLTADSVRSLSLSSFSSSFFGLSLFFFFFLLFISIFHHYSESPILAI